MTSNKNAKPIALGIFLSAGNLQLTGAPQVAVSATPSTIASPASPRA
jgi:hypothetical protein